MNQIRRKLLLHVDINKTILIQDSVTNKSARDVLIELVSEASFGKVSKNDGKWVWDGKDPLEPTNHLPPLNSSSLSYSTYLHKKLAYIPNSDNSKLKEEKDRIKVKLFLKIQKHLSLFSISFFSISLLIIESIL